MTIQDLKIGDIVQTITGETIRIGYISSQPVKDGYYETAGESPEKCFLIDHLLNSSTVITKARLFT